MRVSARLIRRCIVLGIPTLLENPSGSRLFEAPPIRRLRAHACCSSVTLDQSQLKARWRKRTHLVTWHCGHSFPSLDLRCRGRKGMCSNSEYHHVVLSGRELATGPLYTAIAQAYPRQLAKAIAETLTRTYVRKEADHIVKSFLDSGAAYSEKVAALRQRRDRVESEGAEPPAMGSAGPPYVLDGVGEFGAGALGGRLHPRGVQGGPPSRRAQSAECVCVCVSVLSM